MRPNRQLKLQREFYRIEFIAFARTMWSVQVHIERTNFFFKSLK